MKAQEKPSVAWLGLGAMGVRMVEKLLDAGYPVCVYNRSPNKAEDLKAKGASEAESPKEAASGADVVIAMVTDDPASESIWTAPDTGALHGLKEGAVAIESSTLSPGWVNQWSRAVQERGGLPLDAPVAGSRPQAEAGQLVYLVGGQAETLGRTQDLLEVMGGKVLHIGESGAGAQMKLAVNAWFGMQVVALSEVLGMLAQVGLDPTQSMERLAALPLTSPALKGIGEMMIKRQFAPLFPIDLVAKDMRYFVEAAGGLELFAAKATQKSFVAASQAGYGGDNIHGVVQLYLQGEDEPSFAARRSSSAALARS